MALIWFHHQLPLVQILIWIGIVIILKVVVDFLLFGIYCCLPKKKV